ncbi:hypothetical protein EDF51_10264 [Curtobacterium sp. PhB25]|uniref:S26 family signal peptidase n=1 Tax=unclassified Curtobacterium TaxID=257496 RepID=UPI00104F5290|nr:MULTISPECIES: S26 family signal peptidase [unclassified Curtobacterium]TCU86526.1 hypothetical protein EDF48_102189 [Curtobacterium sp. PhB191]TDW51184.1 hypothetical protein EDF52_102277 [Curtobacterium sp. PhB42]TDW55970.1 hypothetical protein EDF47_10476 [Curtobacterium sp. PhB190]TDW73240.1 hypothetical protein EDF51_10264 [Curtobacterium sp. PhB25]
MTLLIGVGCFGAAAVAFAVLALARYRVYRVYGISMLPALGNGQTVLVRKTTRGIAVGQLVVFDGDKLPYVDCESSSQCFPKEFSGTAVKRVVDIRVQNGGIVFEVLGDNRAASIDSRNFGVISFERVIGVVVGRTGLHGASSQK